MLAVESCKHRMFAVLLWALRVHAISAAAKFSSAHCACFTPLGLGCVGSACGIERRLDVRAMGEC